MSSSVSIIVIIIGCIKKAFSTDIQGELQGFIRNEYFLIIWHLKPSRDGREKKRLEKISEILKHTQGRCQRRDKDVGALLANGGGSRYTSCSDKA